MKVMIDGVQYVPAPPEPEGKDLDAALELRFDSDAGDSMTVRDYLRQLLLTLWDEQEGFNSKRPFGNSGWCYDLYTPLVLGGFISGEVDKDGGVLEGPEADSYVRSLILQAFSKELPP